MKTGRVKKEKKVRNHPGLKPLDLVIVILVVLAVVGVYFRFNSLDFFENRLNMKDYVVSFSIENIRHTTPNHIQVEDRVYFQENGTFMGTLMAASDDMPNIALKTTLATEYFMDESGEMIEVNYPKDSRVRAEGRMICRGTYTDDGSFLLEGETYVAAGKSIPIQTEMVSVSILIQDIQLVEEP